MSPEQPQPPGPEPPVLPENNLEVNHNRGSDRRRKMVLIGLGVVLLVCLAAYFLFRSTDSDQAKSTKSKTPEVASQAAVDVTKLPLGDQKVSTSAKKGYVFSCRTTFDGGGAFKQGPWINTKTNTWDSTKKASVDGDVAWNDANFTLNASKDSRIFTGNGLPKGHHTGIFPIAAKDDAYQYDRNPNSIKTQNLSLTLPANPAQLGTPECVGGEVGIMLSGIPLFNAFDAGGRDAVATEVQDKCAGHPQVSGQYHYHGHSDCLEKSGSRGHSALLGYAFDGFGIYGLRGENGRELASKDLDECHGHYHKINWDGKQTKTYHYHMTRDFPYSVSCFRAKKAITGPLSTVERPLPTTGPSSP